MKFSKRSRVILLASTAEGPGRVVEDIVFALVPEFCFTVVSLTTAEHPEVPEGLRKKGAKVVELRKRWKVDLQVYRQLLSTLHMVRPDLIVSFDFASNIYAWWALRKTNIPWLASVHGLDSAFVTWRLWLQKLAFPSARRIVVPSKAVKEKLEQYRLCAAEKIEVVPNWVSFVNGTENSRYKRAREEKVVGCVANFYSELKGHHFAIEALRHLPRSVYLVCIGDGVLRSRLESYAREIGVADRVSFLGKLSRERTLDELSSFDVLVVPSLSESFGKVILEAMSLEVPVVASNIGGIPEIVQHGSNGILVPSGDAYQLAEAIMRLLNDHVLYCEIAQQARIWVSKQLGADRTVERYKTLFLSTGLESNL